MAQLNNTQINFAAIVTLAFWSYSKYFMFNQIERRNLQATNLISALQCCKVQIYSD